MGAIRTRWPRLGARLLRCPRSRWSPAQSGDWNGNPVAPLTSSSRTVRALKPELPPQR